MFGLCALRPRKKSYSLCCGLLLLGMSLVISATSLAQTSPKARVNSNSTKKIIRSQVLNEGAILYGSPDFDAQILAELPEGEELQVDSSKSGPFYRVRLKNKTVGWLADTDIKGGMEGFKKPSRKSEGSSEEKNYSEKTAETGVRKKKQKFYLQRFWGPVLQYTQVTEKTMGEKFSEFRTVVGAKFVGVNTLFSGGIYIESNILLDPGAPKYYQEKTGQKASGFALYSDFTLQTIRVLTDNNLYFYGLGPMIRYSRYNLKLLSGANIKEYTSDEIGLGLVFNVGWAFRIKDNAVRIDAKYHWERYQYPSAGLFFGFNF